MYVLRIITYLVLDLLAFSKLEYSRKPLTTMPTTYHETSG